MWLYITWLAVIVAALWLYMRQFKARFTEAGVKHLGTGQMLSNTIRVILKTDHFADLINKSYNAFPNERFYCTFEFMNAVILLRDIEVIKRVTVKDFESFIDHRSFVNENTDPLFGRNLLSLKGQEWKDMRSTLSPAFTSSKIRLMVPFMEEVGKQMMNSLMKKIKESNNDYIDVDIKDLTTRYANDVIASCAFGLNVDSLSDVNNEFYVMGKRAVNFGTFTAFIKFILIMAMPKVMSKFKVTLFPKDIRDFFSSMVLGTMKHREERNIVRPDMIHLLMQAKKGVLVHEDKGKDADAGFATVEESVVGKKSIDRVWSDNDLIAQAILFFLGGFETVSSTMAFALHELALNPDVQEKLVQEIRETEARTGGKLDYNTIQNMTYMDMVISELLRLWPPGVQLERQCVKDYNLGKANDDPAAKDYYVRAGEAVVIPVYCIHRDPKYFPDPLKFDPERFSEENKHKIQPCTYLPFGSGPRNCIGSRFALCEVKVILYQLLQHLEVTPNEKTCIPTKLDSSSFNFGILGGHWLRLKKRT